MNKNPNTIKKKKHNKTFFTWKEPVSKQSTGH